LPRLSKALALSASDWLLIAQATLWSALIEFGLHFLPLRTVLPKVHRERRSGREACDPMSAIPERAAYCVEVASRLYPRQTCLKKALVLYSLLSRSGFDVQVQIGAARDRGRLDAHAWVEHRGRIILGASTPGRYASLCALGKSSAGTRPHEQVAS
jgi:hypothetical protein